METAPAAFDISLLLHPGAFPHPVESVSLRETHISWIVLTGRFAYKIKKPVRTDFIDASTLVLRRRHCEAEVRLNARLAPGLYLGVVPITCRDGQPVIGGDGEPCEYAVRMRQFAADDELPSLLERNAVEAADIESLGTMLADFHLSLPPVPAEGAGPRTAAMLEAVFANLATLVADLATTGEDRDCTPLVEWTHREAERLAGVFRQRELSGFVRECHGDLHAGNIVKLDGRLVPFDCIDFDAALRTIDVMSDIAFLVMDLASRGRSDLAFVLLTRYLEVTGDHDGVEVLPFHAVYRALVRAKVDAMAARQIPAQASASRARLLHRLQAARAWTQPRTPVLVLMHGVSGSGKSWLSERLVPALPAVRLRSDLERKRMTGGLGGTVRADVGSGIYAPAFSHRVYARLADAAETCLRAGCSVVVDAAFLAGADRELLQGIGRRLHVGFLIVACEVDAGLARTRIAERMRRGGDPSDATGAVLERQLQDLEALSAAEEAHVVRVRTADPGAVQAVLAAAGRRG